MVKVIVTVEKMKKTVVRRSVLSGLSQRPFFSEKGGQGKLTKPSRAAPLTCFSATSLSAQLLVLHICPKTLKEVHMVITMAFFGVSPRQIEIRR